MSDTLPLLEVDALVKTFPNRNGRGGIHAVNHVSFTQRRGETIGIVGESGCGKSTLGRTILQLIRPTSGDVRFLGKQLTLLPDEQLRQMRRHMQMIFQDPYASLDPRMNVASLIAEPLVIHGLGTATERATEVARLLDTVGLPAEAAKRYPHEFSGGQRQRICIARALALHPELIVADEPVSALDVSIQSQILNLLNTLKRERGLTYLFISHNLAVVRYVADTVAVMYLGRIVEMGPAKQIYAAPKHPYTQSLIAAIPALQPGSGPTAPPLQGEAPDPEHPPAGCPFHPRCPHATERCAREAPRAVAVATGPGRHEVACHLHE
jgi:oligopeptide/dipeptide ABC transporter ATP-binding protein